MKGMKWISGSVAVLVLLALVGTVALGAGPSPGPPTQSFRLRGRIVSVKGNDVLIRVTSAPKSIQRYEQKGELNVTLSSEAKVFMGKKAISASMLKPNERVSVTGRYKPSSNPTFEATKITVLSAK